MPLFLRGVDLRVAGVLHDPQRDSSSAQHPKARLTPARIEAKLRAAPSDAPLGHGQQRASLLCGPRRPSQTQRSVLRNLTPPRRRVLPPVSVCGASLFFLDIFFRSPSRELGRSPTAHAFNLNKNCRLHRYGVLCRREIERLCRIRRTFRCGAEPADFRWELC